MRWMTIHIMNLNKFCWTKSKIDLRIYSQSGLDIIQAQRNRPALIWKFFNAENFQRDWLFAWWRNATTPRVRTWRPRKGKARVKRRNSKAAKVYLYCDGAVGIECQKAGSRYHIPGIPFLYIYKVWNNRERDRGVLRYGPDLGDWATPESQPFFRHIQH